MPRVTEDKIKDRLRKLGFAVPNGAAADTPHAARKIASEIGGAVVVKALIAMGRRGKAGAIRFADTPEQAQAAAAELLGKIINGLPCRAVYVEAKVPIEAEFYLAFVLEDFPPQVIASREGGVDIESIHATRPEAVLSRDIDPLCGLHIWHAVDLWEEAGLSGKILPAMAKLTADLYGQFTAADSPMLELNPIGVDAEGKAWIIGAMMESEDPMFEGVDGEEDPSGTTRPLNEREKRVIEANRTLPGGMVRYTELDGDIGLFVGGGGAGLLQHDLILAAGGRPANHTDASTVNPDKVRVLIDAILDNPRVKSLFVSWHYQQMARIDRRVQPVIEALKARCVDPRKFPVVIRMFGPGEDLARKAAAELEGIHYLPHGAPLAEGVRLIVDLTEKAQGPAAVL